MSNFEILRTLRRMEGELVESHRRVETQLAEIHKLSERVSKVELWLSWLRGAWAALAALYAYLCKSFRCN